jgi:hypothetical protein
MKENQAFTTFDVVTVVSLVIAVLSLAGAVIASVALDSSQSQAKLGAEKIANQIILGGIDGYNPEEPGRIPASMTAEERFKLLGNSGNISRDPWGVPYLYRIGSDTQGRKVAVVWSSGPNRKQDTLDFKVDEKGNFMRFEFVNDDLGIVVHQ